MNSNEILIIALAKGLEDYCKRWNYDFIERLKQNPTTDNFIKCFLRITKYYFFEHSGNTYGADFSKKEKTVKIYKCGKGHENILIECPIDMVVKELERSWI